MNIALLFSFGFIIPTLEIHLLSFDISHTFVSLSFILLTASYAFFAFFGAALFQRMEERTTLVAGICIMAVAYLMLAPWEAIFPRSLWVVILSLPLMGLGQAMIYSNA